jgi:ABC-type Fe3+-hydroxamate transport system substrate-binding protein
MRFREVRDMTGRTVFIPEIPQRIVSLVPSQTALLAALGLDKRVVGITRFCEHPREWFLTKNRVGGTKDADPARIRLLQPDLILANKEENTAALVEQLEREIPIWVSDVRHLAHATQMIREVGQLTQTAPKAAEMAQDIERQFAQLKTLQKPLKVVYVIWKNPWMAVSGDTFIGDMLRRIGFENIFEQSPERYPEFVWSELENKPDVVLLSSEPFPFQDRHVDELRAILEHHIHIQLVDGALFSWYGSHLLETPLYFEGISQNISKKSDLYRQDVQDNSFKTNTNFRGANNSL